MTGRPNEPWRLLALPPLPAELVSQLMGDLADHVTVAVPASRDPQGLHAELAEAELVLGDYTGELSLDASAVSAAPRLAFLQQPSAGYEGHDLGALTAAGVPVANTGDANAEAVAEWCVAAALALSRNLLAADRAVRAGGWPQLAVGARELRGLRVGLVGFGAIGAQAARRFAALGCAVSYWSRRRRSPEQEAGAAYRELDALLAWSDVAVVVLALTDDTRGLLDARRLALLPHGAYLINAARGGIVDQRALLAALDAQRLAGAALDVFDPEPPGPADPVRSHDRVLLSPHVAGATDQAQMRILGVALSNLRAAVEGRALSHVVNGVDPVVRRR